MTSPEQHHKGAEVKTSALEQAAAERSAELSRSKEKSGEQYNDLEAARTVEKARAEVNAEAISGKEHGAAEHEQENTASSPVSSYDRNESYRQTMGHIRQEMSAPARTFSKIIHNPVIERTSEVIGNTVARPNAILSGSIMAFVFVLAVYLLARHIGFSLSGFETIGLFALGWALGVSFDIIRGIFKR